MVGQWPLKPLIGVRIPVPQQKTKLFLMGKESAGHLRQGFEKVVSILKKCLTT